MEEKMMKSNGVDSRSSAMKRRRLFSAAAVLLICCLAFVGAAGAADGVKVAEIVDGGQYESIQEAVEAAGNGDKILVIADHVVEFSEQRVWSNRYIGVWVNSEKTITIDLNGKEVMFNPQQQAIPLLVTGGAKLTLQDGIGGGKLEAVSNNLQSEIYSLLCLSDDGSEMLVKSGDYIADAVSSALVYANTNKAITVEGGTFYLGNLGKGPNGNGSPWIFNAMENDANRIVVTGGTFNADVNHKHWEYEVYVPKERALRDNGDGNWTVVDAVAYVTEYQTRNTWFNNNPDDIGGSKYERNVGYATVEDAVSNVGKHHASSRTDDFGQYTITLIEDADVTETLKFGTSESPLAKPTVFNMDGHKLIWKGNANNDILTVSGNYGLKINSFDIEWEGHEIKMWKKDDVNCETLPENGASSVDVSQSLSVADSEVNKYTIKFDTNGGSAVGDITLDYGTEIDAPANPTKTGYTFRDWNPEIPATMPAKDMTVIAQWVANTSTVTFDADEGTVSEPTKEVTFDQPYGTLPIPTREGHDFVGWYLDDTLITENIKVTVDEDHTLTAHWEKIETPSDTPEEEEIITPPSSGGGGDGGHLSFPRTTENGGLVDFGSSKVVKALMLPEGSSGSVLLKVDTVEKWPKALDTEYTFDISVEKLGEGMAYIHFEIPVSALESLELTPADICAYHFEGEVWTKLPTTYEVKDGTVCYEAETDSFSPFKLVIEEGAATQKEEENVPTVPPTEEPDVPDEPEILPPIDEPTKPTEPETPAPILAVLAGLGAAVIVRRK